MKQNFLKGALFAPFFVVSLPTLAAEGGVDLTSQVINCLIFFGGLAFILRNVIRDFFGNRVKGIRDDHAMAEKSREEAKRRLDEIDEKMANLDREVAEIEAQARQEAEHARERVLKNAEQEAARIMEQALAEIESRRREAVGQLKAHIAEMAIKEAEQTVRDSITDGERKKLLADFTTQLGARS